MGLNEYRVVQVCEELILGVFFKGFQGIGNIIGLWEKINEKEKFEECAYSKYSE